jgi:uncharacterized surface protein with fasciclin (FAS1) repeats
MVRRIDLRAAIAAVLLVFALAPGPAAAADIVDTAAATGDFETLLAAVRAAGLAEVLKGEGPFTVFAPTDAAFAALPEGTVASLLRPENRDRLVDLLTYHVISGEVPAEVAVTLDEGTTVNGQRVDLDFDGETLTVDGARVVTADVAAGNGVIHVIDRVLMPDEDERRAADARRLIERAIDRGAPMYNHGQRAACTAVYMTAAEGLLMGDVLSAESASALRRARWRAGNASDAGDRAWIMRRALDRVYEDLSSVRTTAE